MKAQSIYETIHFERNREPKQSMNIGLSIQDLLRKEGYQIIDYSIENLVKYRSYMHEDEVATMINFIDPDGLHFYKFWWWPNRWKDDPFFDEPEKTIQPDYYYRMTIDTEMRERKGTSNNLPVNLFNLIIEEIKEHEKEHSRKTRKKLKMNESFDDDDPGFVKIEYVDTGFIKVEYRRMVSEDDDELLEGRMIDEYFVRQYIGLKLALSRQDIHEELDIMNVKPVKNTYSNDDWIVETNFGNITLTTAEFEKIYDISKRRK